MSFSKIEIILLLAYYLLEKGRDIDAFAKRFNRYFGKDFSTQTLLYYVSNFKYLDPSNNMLRGGDDKARADFLDVWKEYVDGDKLGDLKQVYRVFKKEAFANPDLVSFVDVPQIHEVASYQSGDPFEDFPVEVPEYRTTNGEFVFPRSKMVAINALQNANHLCEAACKSELFVRKGSTDFYTEAHHLIPLSFQSQFSVSLDVEANVVSLCPNCHSLLHYGNHKEALLRRLYDMRKERLVRCGINISFEELLLLYR